MSQTTDRYRKGGQIVVAIFYFLYMSTLFIAMIAFADWQLSDGYHALNIWTPIAET